MTGTKTFSFTTFALGTLEMLYLLACTGKPTTTEARRFFAEGGGVGWAATAGCWPVLAAAGDTARECRKCHTTAADRIATRYRSPSFRTKRRAVAPKPIEQSAVLSGCRAALCYKL